MKIRFLAIRNNSDEKKNNAFSVISTILALFRNLYIKTRQPSGKFTAIWALLLLLSFGFGEARQL